MFLGSAAMAETPDTLIDYVRSDGTQYFDTGVIGKAYTKAEMDFNAEAIPKHGSYIFGSKGTDNNIVAPWYFNYGMGSYYGNNNNDLINSYGHPCENARYRYVSTLEPNYQATYWYDNDLTYPTNGHKTATYSGSTGLSMYLFALNNKGSAQLVEQNPDRAFIGLRLYGLKVWQKDSAEGEYSLVRDYRPAIKNGKVCLYDDVEKTIIYPKAADGSETTIGPRIRYVYSSDHDGMTPIQQLTNAVATAESGDVIILQRGTYTFPDDVYMDDNTLAPDHNSYCKFRLNLTQGNVTICGEDDSSRKTWTHGDEPVVIEGNGAKALQIAIPDNESAQISNITFADCFGGHNGDGASGNRCAGGAIGIGRLRDGYKGSSNVVITNCAFRGNLATLGGAIGSNGSISYVVQDCYFTNNIAESKGGGMYSGNAYGCDFVGNRSCCENSKEVRDCRFLYNVSHQCVVKTVTSIRDCLFIGNSITNKEWITIANSPLVSNCHFTNNTCGAYGVIEANGGVVTNCTVHKSSNGDQKRAAINNASLVVDCRVTCNHGYYCGGVLVDVARNASGVSNQVYTYVKDCYFGGNDSSQGGGVVNFSTNLSFAAYSLREEYLKYLQKPFITFDHCTFETNWVNSSAGGGAIFCDPKELPEGIVPESLVVCSNNCIFAGNKSGIGGGVWGATVIGSNLKNIGYYTGTGYKGTDAAKSRLVDCELTGGNLYMCSLDRCHVHDVTNNACVFNNGCHVTNTLVSGCAVTEAVIGRKNTDLQQQADFVNCTFVANEGDFFKEANLINMINCAFFFNTNSTGTATAISYSSAADNDGNTTFDHCAFGPIVDGALPLYPAIAENYMDLNPRFVAERSETEKYAGEPYYSPLPSSPLCSRGLMLGFTDSDLDLSGRLRVGADERVDIGCYECWVVPDSLIMTFR